MNNEPVAIRYDFDGYGYQYMDSGSGSDWQSRVKGEPLYTHPPQEPDCYGDGNVYRGVRSKDSEVQTIHIGGVKELSDFEILQISECYPDRLHFARAILRKEQEK